MDEILANLGFVERPSVWARRSFWFRRNPHNDRKEWYIWHEPSRCYRFEAEDPTTGKLFEIHPPSA